MLSTCVIAWTFDTTVLPSLLAQAQHSQSEKIKKLKF